MDVIFRRIERCPVPLLAECITKNGRVVTQWRSRGKSRSAAIETDPSGAEFVAIKCTIYSARYRDHVGKLIERTTGCRDETAARQTLARREREAEKVRAGVLCVEDLETARTSTPTSSPLPPPLLAPVTRPTPSEPFAALLPNSAS